MKEVTILGMGPSYIELQKPFGELWAVLYQVRHCRHIDRLFCAHDWGMYDPETMEIIRQRQEAEGFQIISTMPPPAPIKGTPYPIEEVITDFQTKYFRDIVCFMIALAIHEGYDPIHFYGVDCRSYSTYAEEKAPTEFWCGVARGRGIQLHIASMSPLCHLLDDAGQPINLPEKEMCHRL